MVRTTSVPDFVMFLFRSEILRSPRERLVQVPYVSYLVNVLGMVSTVFGEVSFGQNRIER